MPADSIEFETLATRTDFRRLSSIAGLRTDLRYATSHNFMGRNLYANLDCAWLRVPAAEGLELAIEFLQRQAPTVQLVVLDALRPHRIQELLWANLSSSPLRRYLADPQIGSMHSYGMAVDVTLLDRSGVELDMGSAFDQMDQLSHPELEANLLAAGQLTALHIERRQLLREAMMRGGFAGIRTEWWHFDCGDKTWVRAELGRVA